MYLIIRQGVYQQGIFGLFDSLEQARTHVVRCLEQEPDDYHEFLVYSIKLNEGLSLEGFIGETSPEVRVKRNKAKVTVEYP